MPDIDDILENAANSQDAGKSTKKLVTKKEKENNDDTLTMPQDRFKKTLVDLGFSKGSNTITDVFFQGDIDSPAYLDSVLKVSGIPARNRSMILTSWYGKTPEELGIKIEPTNISSTTQVVANLEQKKIEDQKVLDEFDPSKLAAADLRDMMNREKTAAAMAQITATRLEAEERANAVKLRSNPPPAPVAQQVYRQIRKPIFNKEGGLVLDTAGQPIFETISEPVFQGESHNSGGIDMVSMLGLIKSMGNDNKNQDNPAITTLMTEIKNQNANRALDEKNNEIKRLIDKMEAAEREHKSEKDRIEDKLQEKLDRVLADNAKNLESLKERFMESIQHQKDIDQIAGSLSERHKKEMDEIKKQLTNSQSSIEKTIIAKATDTSNDVVRSITDITKSVVEPMAGVMKDHYSTMIDQSRAANGLPPLNKTIQDVSEEELKNFIEG